MTRALALLYLFVLSVLSGLAPGASPTWLDASAATAAPSTLAYDDGGYRYDSVNPVDRGVDAPPRGSVHAYDGVLNPVRARSAFAQSVFAAKAGSAAPNRIYSARVLGRAADEPGPYHNFPASFNDDIFERGTRTAVPDFFKQAKPGLANDSIQYRLPGSINGRSGVFEIFARPSLSGRTELITHRFFRPNP